MNFGFQPFGANLPSPITKKHRNLNYMKATPMNQVRSGKFCRNLLLLLLIPLQTHAGDDSICAGTEAQQCDENKASNLVMPALHGGPEQVENRLHIDANITTPIFGEGFAKDYFAWKARLKKNYGLNFGGDYSSVYLSARESAGEENAFGGMYRFYGSWEPISDGSGNSGALIFKVEHRHAYGSEVPPGSFGFETGYIGLYEPPFSDQQTRLTNLYWRQRIKGGDMVIIGGFVDSTDYMDVYMLASPWTGFYNFAFSTGVATIPVPNEGLGLGLGGYLNDNFYIIAGIADSNSDPHRPGDGFDTFFNDHEYFSHIELGWNKSRDTAFLNNIHLTLWHADEREESATPDGWGAVVSWSQSINEHWMPFVRAGYAEDGGALLEKSISAGFGYQKVTGGNQIGLAFNWGEPMESTWGPDLPEQKSFELFYRIQVFKELAITPDIQYIVDPALNLQEDSMWVAGLRVRLAF
jgi:porin